MGRKIPAKKHRGVKDPLKQQAQRIRSIKDKINAPPTDPDEQPVPRSLQRLFAFQEPQATATKIKKKKARTLTGGKHDDNAVAALQRLPGEAGRAFSLRINSAVRALQNTDQEDYPVDLEDTDTRGEYIASQRLRRQRKHRQALAKGGAGAEGGKGVKSGEGERLSKTQRRALKRKEQQKAKQAETSASRDLDARELRYERVAFGDVAHAPPTLLPPRRAQKDKGAPRPGRRDLLLASMLNPTAHAHQPEHKSKPAPVTAAVQMHRERARIAAVDAYRALKKQRAAEKGKSR